MLGQRHGHPHHVHRRLAARIATGRGALQAGVEVRLDIVHEFQALAHIAQRDAMARGGRARALCRHRVAHGQHGAPALHLGAYHDPAAQRVGLDAVAHGVFHQWLQDQGRHLGLRGVVVQLPAHGDALSKAELLDAEVAPRQFDLFGQGGAHRGRGQRLAEQLGQVFQHGFGALRVDLHQRDRRVERVEQEVRADARLQLGQAGRGMRRQLAVRTVLEPGQAHAGQGCAGEHGWHQGPAPGPARHAGPQVQPGQLPLRQGAHHGAQAHRRHPLPRLTLARQPAADAAGHHQPQQAGRQGHHGQLRPARQGIGRPQRLERLGQAHHQLHAQHHAQHHAHVADVQGRGGRCGRRRRTGRRITARLGQRELGRHRPARRRRRWRS